MIQLITSNMNIEMKELLGNTNNYFNMICPFIGFNTAKYLVDVIIKNNIKATIITRFSRNDFYKKVSSIEGIKLLKEAGAVIKAVKNLHTKLYIFDNYSIILGSSNFTDGGLITNIELNIFIEEENEIIMRAVNYFDEININIDNEFIIDMEKIDNEIRILKSIPNDKQRVFDSDFGMIFLPKTKSDVIEQLFTENIFDANEETSAWLKFEGFSDDRRSLNTIPLNINLNDDNCYRTHFPRKPIGFKNGDIIFIGRNSWDKNNDKTPIIYGYGITKEFNEKNVVTKDEIEKNENYKRWPYYIFVEKFKYINGVLKNGISLLDLYREIGNNTFPTTRNLNKTFEELKMMHSQKDKLRITNEAKDFLLKCLNEIIN